MPETKYAVSYLLFSDNTLPTATVPCPLPSAAAAPEGAKLTACATPGHVLATAAVEHAAGERRFMTVQRPADDANLPNAWGLPAGMVAIADAESGPTDSEWAAAVVLSGRQKLGVDLEVGPVLGEGTLPRGAYTLHMRQFAVALKPSVGDAAPSDSETDVDGLTATIAGLQHPVCPQAVAGVTQYQRWRWEADVAALAPAAKVGSLCSQLYTQLTNEAR